MKENYFWHKLHSLTGIIPVGFYLVQHLFLNTFSIAGPERFNSVPHFFESLPAHLMLILRYGVIWPALIFHAVYGLFIWSRGKENYTNSVLKYRENRYYWLQRVSGIFVFIFLCYHMSTTSVYAQAAGVEVIEYATWKGRLLQGFGLIGVFYVLGVVASAYHLCYGIWNFCIRWGITVSEKAQNSVAKFSFAAFLLISAIGIAALAGFFMHSSEEGVRVEAPTQSISVGYLD